MPELIIKIDEETGAMTMEVEGVTGPACEQTLNEAQQYYGQPTKEELKPQYHVRTNTKVKQITRR